MAKVLIVAEHDGSKLNPATAKCVACASQIAGAEISIAVFAADPTTVAAQAAALQGVVQVHTVAHPLHAQPMAATVAPQLAELAAGHSHVFGPSTTFGKDLMPRVAALLGAPQISDVMAAESATRFKRPIYAGNAIITVEIPADRQIVATVRVASYQPVAAQAASAPIVAATPAASVPTHTRFVSVTSARSDRPDLQTASKVVSGGRALGSAENFQILYSLADRLGAAVGASRAAVDAGYAANDMQVGQTGKIIAPELYLAFGISGAIQHLTGIKDARTIVAINKDAEAPIFEVADIGLVGDLFQIVPEIEKLIAQSN
jgi:electron transfer flavoprotein alpha subunit